MSDSYFSHLHYIATNRSVIVLVVVVASCAYMHMWPVCGGAFTYVHTYCYRYHINISYSYIVRIYYNI